MSEQSTICALCQHFKMKEYPDHARVGAGRCMGYDGTREQLIHPFLSWKTRACVRYARARNIAEREAWVAKQGAPAPTNNAAQPGKT